MYFFFLKGLAYFWRAKHKQEIVFYLYFYVPWGYDVKVKFELN